MSNLPRSPIAVRVTARLTSAYQTQGPGNRLALTSSGVVAAPFKQGDWPNPQRKPFAVSLRTHIDGQRLNLYGQDQFFGAPGMGPDYDFPNPLRRRQPITLDPPNRLALTSTPAGSPLTQTDWPNPNRRRSPLHEAGLRSIALDVVAPVAPPFFGLAMDNPVLRLWSRWQHPFQQTQLPAIFATPPVQVSTALPLRRPPAHVGFVQPTFGPLVPTGPKPFAQTEWPNPLRARQFHTGPWGLWAQVIPAAPEPECVHEVTAEPLSALTLTAGSLAGGSLTASPLTATTITAEPPC